jgi:hypothetical protein
VVTSPSPAMRLEIIKFRLARLLKAGRRATRRAIDWLDPRQD